MKTFLFSLSILFYAVAFIAVDRLHLPWSGGAVVANFDDLSFVLLLGTFIHVLFLLPDRMRVILTPLVLVLVFLRRFILFGAIVLLQLLMIGEWWHFEFYRDYIHYASLGYLGDWQEISRGVTGFQGRYLALLVSLVLLAALYGLEKYWSTRQPPRKQLWIATGVLALLSATMLGMSSYLYFKASDENWQTTQHFPLAMKNPVLELLREKWIGRQELATITESNRQALQALYPGRTTATAAGGDFPFYVSSSAPGLLAKKYNVIVIVGESFRGYETGKHDGMSLTPNFDRIARQAITADNFYANSNQTIKGEIAILCGLHDFLVGNSISSYESNLKTRCLPEIFRDQGYDTLWFHGGYKDFYNRNTFFPKIGFNRIVDREVIENDLYARGQKYFIRHWGVEDPYMFDYTFEQLQKEQQPFFAEIMTLSAHHPFFDIENRWDIQNFPPAIRGDMGNMYRKYQHAIYYTDRALGAFWDKFSHSPLAQNTIVIIVGDHGIWLFPDGVEQRDSEARLYEMYTRLPFAMYVPGLPPHVIHEPLSQVDIPVLLTAALGLDQHVAFQSGLDHAQARALLRGQPSPATANNPVLATLGDSVFFRRGSDRCFPTVASKAGCRDYLFRCVQEKHVLRSSGMACYQWSGDVLGQPSIQPHPSSVDIDLPAAAVDFFRKSLFIGQVPPAASTTKAIDSKLTHE